MPFTVRQHLCAARTQVFQKLDSWKVGIPRWTYHAYDSYDSDPNFTNIYQPLDCKALFLLQLIKLVVRVVSFSRSQIVDPSCNDWDMESSDIWPKLPNRYN